MGWISRSTKKEHMTKVALITGVTGQDGAIWQSFY